MSNPRFAKKFACLAALTTATCWALGLQCLLDIFASLGATLF